MLLAAPDMAVAEYGFGTRHVYAAVFASDHGFSVLHRWRAALCGLFGCASVDLVFFALAGKDACQQQATYDQHGPE